MKTVISNNKEKNNNNAKKYAVSRLRFAKQLQNTGNSYPILLFCSLTLSITQLLVNKDYQYHPPCVAK